ncbi:type IV pilus secretin PilQ [Thiorhodovibrio frisius]|uniref:Type IV pilus secretin PilQ/competence protein n=1 Tax=Thiorhodovibrio frisius TaxID=631362 RepID=H8YY22_9GAMM|nr:type IV pilus secretin PilQ [Thiorhodovibrio frisius]EIC23348.1 type IV pilus secretin PilQ/competence protein [Thiorhodovibrio frisius]WPL23572.1 Type IV pilus biogenesis and competence protein PilQ precursor [Thiorhodovibrio frisius]
MTRRKTEIHSTHGFERRRFRGAASACLDGSRPVLRPFLLFGLLLPLAAGAATLLEDVEFSSLPGNAVEVDLIFSGTPPTATDFATDNPARIAIDLPDVTTDLTSKEVPIGIGVAQSLNAIQAGSRTRVVLNLADAVPYKLRTDGNRIIVGLNMPAADVVTEVDLADEDLRPGDSPAGETADTAATGDLIPPAEVAPEMPRQIGALRTSRFGREAASNRRAALKNIDFRRGADGAGRVLISLPSASTPVNVREQGDSVVVDIGNTQLPQRLFRRLDVVDFATPVVAVESRAEGEDIQVKIDTTEDYDYLAYQSDNLFTVEFRALTPAEKEQLERDKVVYDGDRLSLNFQDIEVRAVLQLLADFTGLNLVASDTVRGNITLRLQNVPWDQALDIVLKTKGLSMRQTGNVVMVAPTQEIAAQEKLELESIQQIEELAPLRSEFIQVNYAKAGDLASLIKSEGNNLLSERGAVTVDQRTNTLLVQDTGNKLEEIRALVLRLDIPVRQVLVESRVVIADNNFSRDLGVRFGVSGSMGNIGSNELMISGSQQGNIDDSGTLDMGGFMGIYGAPDSPVNSTIITENDAAGLMVSLPAGTPSGAVNFLLGKVGSHLLQLELSAMQTEGRGEIVSAPRVVTSDGHQATIKLGKEIPYQQEAGGLGGGTTVAFKEALLKLDVTPQITPDDRIIMDLVVNKDNPDYTRERNGVPPIDTRSVETSVLVNNGETVVLGGVFEGDKTFSREQVPWLGDIPVLGNLFKTTGRREINSELLIFVTPKILKGGLAGG